MHKDLSERLWHCISPLQGLGFLWGLLPRALPWAITLCPFGAEDALPCLAGFHGVRDICGSGMDSFPTFISMRLNIFFYG
jgi:hypothetical protein